MIEIKNLRRAVVISEQIESLRAELNSILSGGLSSPTGAKRGRKPKGFVSIEAGNASDAVTAKPRRKRRKLSPEAIQKIRDGQKRRWAKVHREQKKAEK